MNFYNVQIINGRQRSSPDGLFKLLQTAGVDLMADPLWMQHLRALFFSGNEEEMRRIGTELRAMHTDQVMTDQAEHFLFYSLSCSSEGSRLGLLQWETTGDDDYVEFMNSADMEYKIWLQDQEAAKVAEAKRIIEEARVLAARVLAAQHRRSCVIFGGAVLLHLFIAVLAVRCFK